MSKSKEHKINLHQMFAARMDEASAEGIFDLHCCHTGDCPHGKYIDCLKYCHNQGYSAALNDVEAKVSGLVTALENMILSSAGLSFYYRAPNTVGKYTETELRTKIAVMYDRQCVAEDALAEFTDGGRK